MFYVRVAGMAVRLRGREAALGPVDGCPGHLGRLHSLRQADVLAGPTRCLIPPRQKGGSTL